jgi:VanZ family protein
MNCFRMRLIKNLLVPKQLPFLIALSWTAVVSYLCLVESSGIPVIDIPNLDKCIHTFFHFVFTSVWFLFFYKQLKLVSVFKALLIAFLLSVTFGISIEIMQKLFTTTRHADIFDVLANSIGALSAAFLIFVYKQSNFLKRIMND